MAYLARAVSALRKPYWSSSLLNSVVTSGRYGSTCLVCDISFVVRIWWVPFNVNMFLFTLLCIQTLQSFPQKTGPSWPSLRHYGEAAPAAMHLGATRQV